MTTENNTTPEALLKRAVEALNRAEADSGENGGTSWDWVGVSQAAVGAGQLALDIQNSEPRTVVVDDLSGVGQMMLGQTQFVEDPNIPRGVAVAGFEMKPGPVVSNPEHHTTLTIAPPGKQLEGLNVWLTPDEWDTILALRVGAAVVMHRKPSVEAPESPVDDLADVAGTHDHPRDLDYSDVAADGDRNEALVTIEAQHQKLLVDYNAQEKRYRTIIVGMLLRRGVRSEYVSGSLIRQTPSYRLEIGENPADGALTLRIDNDHS